MPYEDIPQDPSLAEPVPDSPFPIVTRWLAEAREGRVQRNPTSMSVATVDEHGHPSLRVVLCRGYEPDPGYFVFYTNRDSRKGDHLRAQPEVAASFHWDALQRQVRIRGPVVESPDTESDAYFASRPRPSQIAAWASAQSEPIASRQAFLDALAQTEARFGGAEGGPVPRPPRWGGYRVFAREIELWVGSEGRAHDRVEWRRELTPTGQGFKGGPWSATRLQP